MNALRLVAISAALAVGLVLPGVAGAAPRVGGCVIEPHASCQGADLAGAELEDAHLAGANLAGANLSGANLAGAHLTEADLSHANLDRADLTRAHLHGATLNGASLRRADLPGAVVSRASLQHADLVEASFWQADLTGSQLDVSDLRGAILSGAVLPEANFAASVLDDARLVAADARGANFWGARLAGATFAHADIRDASFAHAHFDHTHMWGTARRGATLWPSDFSSDETAVEDLYKKVHLHLDAYNEWGSCQPDPPADFKPFIGYLPNADMACSGTGQRTGTDAFEGPVTFGWNAGHVLFRSKDVAMKAARNWNFGELEVTDLDVLTSSSGFDWVRPTETATGQYAGTPGGPLYGNLVFRRYFDVPLAPGGYTYMVRGWLPYRDFDRASSSGPGTRRHHRRCVRGSARHRSSMRVVRVCGRLSRRG